MSVQAVDSTTMKFAIQSCLSLRVYALKVAHIYLGGYRHKVAQVDNVRTE